MRTSQGWGPRIARIASAWLLMMAMLIWVPDQTTSPLGFSPGLGASVQAMPMFTRKYKTSCSTCHYAFPSLNAAGEAFKANGYRFPNGEDSTLRQDEPVSLGAEEQKRVFPDAIWPSDIPGTVPVAIQGIGRYNYSRPAAVKWSFEFPHELEVFIAGTLGDHFSFFGEAELENSGNEVEVAFPLWLQYDLAPAFHVRMGAVEIEPSRSALRHTRNHFNTNSFTSRNGWRFRDEAFGVELWGATNGIGNRGGFTYHLGVVNGQGPFVDLNPTKDVFARATFKFGGLGEAGGIGDGVSDPNPRFYIDNSFTVGAFGYRGKARHATTSVDETFRIAGVNAEAWLDRLRLETVLMQMDSEIPNRADRVSRVAYLEGSVVAFPWIIPITRYEWQDADVDLDTVQPVKSIIVAVAALPTANIKFISEFKKALDTLNKNRRNDSFTLQINFAF